MTGIQGAAFSLKSSDGFNVGLVMKASLAAFATYLSMYAFRKPFTASTYDGLYLFGFQYKLLLIIAQLLGYTVSKYVGIKLIAELNDKNRVAMLVGLMSFALLTLFLFGMIPFPYNLPLMFLNGLPLGMIWGVVFSFLEGRRTTEFLGAVMASSFIVSSGIVKSAGSWFLNIGRVSDMWMPFVTASAFIPLLFFGITQLKKLPKPDSSDQQCRTERVPMNKTDREIFFRRFAPGIVVSVLIYVALTVFRDLRDNFAVEYWQAIGLGDDPALLTFSELPVAILVLVMIAMMVMIRNNRIAFFSTIFISSCSGSILVLVTWLFFQGQLSGLIWMMLAGALMYLPYIAYHTLYFERWIAFFQYKGNAGFLMYMADATGYLGSLIVLLFKSFATPEMSWVDFFTYTGFIVGGIVLLLSFGGFFYFFSLSKKMVKANL
jgi:Family of unknown function (DUF5690)